MQFLNSIKKNEYGFEKKEMQAEIISLQESYNICNKLAVKITAASISFDAIVAIARGGFPPARFLCDFLNIEKIYAVQIKHYGSGAEEKNKTEVISENLGDLGGKKILLVDDVNDSGKSLSAAYDLLGKAEMVKTAVIHEKKNTEFKADFVGEKIYEWRWLIYQWAVAEDVLSFLNEGNRLDTDLHSAKQYLKNQYKLEIEDPLLEKILKMKSNYF